ncbi:hypothetical protein [Streptomyces sp. GS7]|uniref:hypothetical protein n=1 Tax=Streptomyces sp. GS7 TaxID=2692234 RepID=UPI0013165AD9|nr:hypothetical protein [Streptomyces sp. GS7]QHC23028.1 hypothetical protein GR130_18040 [Streptomyces sp. GS7]
MNVVEQAVLGEPAQHLSDAANPCSSRRHRQAWLDRAPTATATPPPPAGLTRLDHSCARCAALARAGRRPRCRPARSVKGFALAAAIMISAHNRAQMGMGAYGAPG